MSADTVCFDKYLLARQLPPPDDYLALMRRELVTLLDSRVKLQTAHEAAAHARASFRELRQPLDPNAFSNLKHSIMPYNGGWLLPVIYSSTTGSFVGMIDQRLHVAPTCLLPTALDEQAKLEAIDAVLGTDTYTLPHIYYAFNPTQEYLHSIGIGSMGADNPLISRGIVLNPQVSDQFAAGLRAYADRMARVCHAHLYFEQKAQPHNMAQDLLHRAENTLTAMRGH
ncbi:MAG: hypothetical protein NUV52_04525 [Candidatus Roizmanbacteria bacterium]|nr:hypothetical protein [Candidatus Roizmanbacteria bacterium]